MTHPVTQYAESVLAGDILTGRLVRLACDRHIRDLSEGEKRGLHFDPEYADHTISFFPKFLRHVEGEHAGKPFHLAPHQVFIVGSLFGWLKADGYRRYRHMYWEESRGGGKTPVASGCAVYGLTMDGEEGAQIFVAAVTREQAGIAFRDCRLMAEKSVFANRLVIGENNIAYPATDSFIRPVSSEAKSLDGKRVFMSILDEVHEHRTPLVIDKMVAGNKGRMQPLNIRTTNAGWDRTSVCWFEREYSREVLEGIREDDDWFAYICQLDPCRQCAAEGKSSPQDECKDCDHWWDEKVWKKSNPNLDLTITSEYLRGEVTKGLAIPSKALSVKRFNFGIWTESFSHWLSMDDWDACARVPIDVGPGSTLASLLKGRRCYGGLDLADTNDTASFVLCFPPEDGSLTYTILTWIWVPESMKHRTEQDRVRFQTWISRGHMTATPGDVIDYNYIKAVMGQVRQDYKLKMVAFDPHHSAKIVSDLCDEHGFTVEEKESRQSEKPLLMKFSQSFTMMSPPTKEFAKQISSHTIAHNGNPAMRWQIGNVVIDQNGNSDQRPDKGKSTDKIDGPVAMLMAFDLAVRFGSQKDPVYFWSLR